MVRSFLLSFLITIVKALSLPNEDQFYAAPANIASKKPGDILRYRSVPFPVSITNISPIRPKGAYQFQYRTQNSVGEPSASVVTVLIPWNAKTNHLFAAAFFTDAACPDCSPSVALQENMQSDGIYSKVQMAPIIAALNQGWIVSVADDGGPQASFPSGLQAAYATLDSLRAVKMSGAITEISDDPLITLQGYSGGGITAAWASEMHQSYAPELDIAGVALGGLMPDFQYLAGRVAVDQSLATWGPPVLVGLSHDYKNMAQWLDDNLIPETADEFRKTEGFCISGNDFYKNRTMGAYFKRGAQSWSDPIPTSVFRDTGIMGLRGTPRAPWYLYETIGDQISPINITRALYEKYCAQGANIYYEENQIGLDHSGESVAGYSGAFQWLKYRHAGQRNLLQRGCRKVAVSVDTARAGLGPISDTVFDTFMATLGVPIYRSS